MNKALILSLINKRTVQELYPFVIRILNRFSFEVLNLFHGTEKAASQSYG